MLWTHVRGPSPCFRVKGSRITNWGPIVEGSTKTEYYYIKLSYVFNKHNYLHSLLWTKNTKNLRSVRVDPSIAIVHPHWKIHSTAILPIRRTRNVKQRSAEGDLLGSFQMWFERKSLLSTALTLYVALQRASLIRSAKGGEVCILV